MDIDYFATEEEGAQKLLRRGLTYGWIKVPGKVEMPDMVEIKRAWQNNEAILLPNLLAEPLPNFKEDIEQAHRLMEQVLEGEELSTLFESEPYASRLKEEFDLSSASFEEHDDQGIEKVFFDAWQEDDIVADDLWCKASWLSFDEEDASLRFRFSFGMEGYEDVAADPERQVWAAKLTDLIFPESSILTENAQVKKVLSDMLESERISFAEKIVYFNAPNGGAQMHHDVERGHDGVVFAQLSGSTFWLAIAKPKLMAEIESFLQQNPGWPKLRELVSDPKSFSDYLDEDDHEWVEALIDRSPDFFKFLIEKGYAYVLDAGDVLLMPQYSLDSCVWHSVICLGSEPGEALSFALKKAVDRQ